MSDADIIDELNEKCKDLIDTEHLKIAEIEDYKWNSVMLKQFKIGLEEDKSFYKFTHNGSTDYPEGIKLREKILIEVERKLAIASDTIPDEEQKEPHKFIKVLKLPQQEMYF